MLSTYRILATTEGRRNGLLQLKRLCRMLRDQGIQYRVEEKKIPVDDYREISVFDPGWFKKKFFSAERPDTYFEVTFNAATKSLSTTIDGGAPVR